MTKMPGGKRQTGEPYCPVAERALLQEYEIRGWMDTHYCVLRERKDSLERWMR